jgi:hypothetical protein
MPNIDSAMTATKPSAAEDGVERLLPAVQRAVVSASSPFGPGTSPVAARSR